MRQFRALVVIGALVIAGQAAARPSAAPATYKVKRGDTLSHIAHRYRTTIDALVVANSLTSAHRIREGQVLKLAAPAPSPSTPATRNASSSRPAPSSGTPLSDDHFVVNANGTSTYVVARGDTLGKIASRFSTTVAELRRLNNLKASSSIRPGQTLTVPGGTWVCPVRGRTNFGDSFRQPRSGGRQHAGTDMFAARGTPVVAPVSGTLSYRNGSIGGLAFYLKGVDGITYYGSHMDSQTAPTGPVKQGAVIGTVGDTGNAKGTTPHLHFEIHPRGTAVNPYPTLRKHC